MASRPSQREANLCVVSPTSFLHIPVCNESESKATTATVVMIPEANQAAGAQTIAMHAKDSQANRSTWSLVYLMQGELNNHRKCNARERKSSRKEFWRLLDK